MARGSIHSPFPETRWSLVLRAGVEGDTEVARRALDELCATYWYPLYAFARRSGWVRQDAEDLTQEFFGRLVKRSLFADARADRGKLRTFLLTAFRHLLADAFDRARALKRGGDREFVTLDVTGGEDRYAREPADPVTPETLYERNWALAVVQQAVDSLRMAEEEAGRGALFRQCVPFLLPDGAGAGSYASVAKEARLGEDAAWQAVTRLRKRFRAMLRQQIAETLEIPTAEYIEAELSSLRAALLG